jgi:hypothetical protein
LSRITRILTCMTITGLEMLQQEWLKFLLSEIYDFKILKEFSDSFEKYWLKTSKNTDFLYRISNIKSLILKY